MTQKDVAIKLGVEPAAISKYELDMREPNIEALKKLGEIFDVSIDYLLGRTPDIFVGEADKIEVDLKSIKETTRRTGNVIKDVKQMYSVQLPININGLDSVLDYFIFKTTNKIDTGSMDLIIYTSRGKLTKTILFDNTIPETF